MRWWCSLFSAVGLSDCVCECAAVMCCFALFLVVCSFHPSSSDQSSSFLNALLHKHTPHVIAHTKVTKHTLIFMYIFVFLILFILIFFIYLWLLRKELETRSPIRLRLLHDATIAGKRRDSHVRVTDDHHCSIRGTV